MTLGRFILGSLSAALVSALNGIALVVRAVSDAYTIGPGSVSTMAINRRPRRREAARV